ncbi:MAG: glycoside hydrolase family 127 protein [Bacteroidota bacterium]|nr:glycoside hydrolase family 127 protein [Bacteroidota bacterium]
MFVAVHHREGKKYPAGKALLAVLLFSFQYLFAQQTDYPIQAIPFTQVSLTDHFWLPRILINRKVTIPASFERCESTGRVKNFVMAAKHAGKFCTRFPFDDTDIYKTIEGASYSLALYPDPKLEAYLDSLIVIIGNAQEPDGYLYTARTINPDSVGSWVGKERWVKERELSHELYNAGHLYEAAVAHYMATRKKSLLTIALKNADLVCSVFGPGKKSVAPGHEIVEMGLVKLFRVTGEKKYLSTAKFFLEARGHYTGYDPNSRDPFKNGAYWQDNIPVVDQDEAEGHAVRAGYLYSAMADVAALTGDDSLKQAVDRIWTNMVSRKMYVQGSVGAIGNGERYGMDYELPNATAYNETCASIANVYFNYRMFLLHGDARYMDVLEKILYNGLISGIGLDGKSFFYTNAMQITDSFKHPDIEFTRSGWFECSCCPTNLVRLIPSIPGYVYAEKQDNLYVNLFINGKGRFSVLQTPVEIEQKNEYPWKGNLLFIIQPQKEVSFAMRIRIPGWAQDEAMPSDLYHFISAKKSNIIIKVNGKPVSYRMEQGYAVIRKTWQKNDRVELVLPMPVRKVAANEKLTEDIGKLAIQRGPIMYCAEWKDNEGKASNLIVPADTKFISTFQPGLLNGVTVLKATVPAVVIQHPDKTATVTRTLTAIPYYSWANRGKGEMTVWFPATVKNSTSLHK